MPPEQRRRFLVDENLPRELAVRLRTEGYDAAHVYDIGLRGAPDRQIYAYAQEQAQCIITADLGFGNPYEYPLPHAGIIVVRLPDTLSPDSRTRIIVTALTALPDMSLKDLLITVEPNRVRIHR